MLRRIEKVCDTPYMLRPQRTSCLKGSIHGIRHDALYECHKHRSSLRLNFMHPCTGLQVRDCRHKSYSAIYKGVQSLTTCFSAWDCIQGQLSTHLSLIGWRLLGLLPSIVG